MNMNTATNTTAPKPMTEATTAPATNFADLIAEQEKIANQAKAEQEKIAIQAQLAQDEIAKKIKDAMKVERPKALAQVKKQVELFQFTVYELGLVEKEVAVKQKNPTIKPLKSTKSDEVGIWTKQPPRFLVDEGCITTYKEGKSVDAWLVDANNIDQKIKFLAKLADHENGKKPNAVQLGSITEKEYTEAVQKAKEKAEKVKASKSKAEATPTATTTA
jgi:hypothetical protein